MTDLVIVGAPRSGTNMLRDALCRLPGFDTWPCDEINFIWRHGNARWPSDLLAEEHARPSVVRYIQKRFSDQRRATGCDVLVEKTCANSLRVPFVDRVVAGAKFVFIHRNPVDAVASASNRWNAPLEVRYTMAKARFVPRSDLMYYGIRFLANRIYLRLSSKRRLASWGPRLEGMDELLKRHTLTEVCALQWRDCAKGASEAFLSMDPGRVHVVNYETFVNEPEAGLAEICDFLGGSRAPRDLRRATIEVRSDSVGWGRRQLAINDRIAVETLVEPGLVSVRRLVVSRSEQLGTASVSPEPPSSVGVAKHAH
jgi:hypothetical protein